MSTKGDTGKAQEKESLLYSQVLEARGMACPKGPRGKTQSWSGGREARQRGKAEQGILFRTGYSEYFGGVWGDRDGP